VHGTTQYKNVKYSDIITGVIAGVDFVLFVIEMSGVVRGEHWAGIMAVVNRLPARLGWGRRSTCEKVVTAAVRCRSVNQWQYAAGSRAITTMTDV